MRYQIRTIEDKEVVQEVKFWKEVSNALNYAEYNTGQRCEVYDTHTEKVIM